MTYHGANTERLLAFLRQQIAYEEAAVAAKRKMLEDTFYQLAEADSSATHEYAGFERTAEDFLLLMAAQYAHRPGYREEWGERRD